MSNSTTIRSGHCHCGAVRYAVEGEPNQVALCHCKDCTRTAGAPVVAWAGFAADQFKVTQGTPKTRNSSGSAMRSFCGDCGSGLFYRNEEFLPGHVEVQMATLEDPSAFAPTAHIQVADSISWMARAHELPSFERFPPQE